MAATLIGAGSEYVSTEALFPLGTVQVFGNKPYTYVKAGAAIDADDVVEVSASTFITESGTGFTAEVDVPSGSYFWIAQTANPLYTATA